MRLALSHSDWLLGFEDETWWSRFEQPKLYAWAQEDQPLRLIEQVKASADVEAKALACYGLLVRFPDAQPEAEQVWLRFVDGRPVSAITIAFLDWLCEKALALDKHVLALVWDNASWHNSQAVRQWVRHHNQHVKQTGQGVRLLICPLPVKSPWLNPIEPQWLHAKRRILEPDRTLSIPELLERICSTFSCSHEARLSIPEKVS
jgi:transposase